MRRRQLLDQAHQIIATSGTGGLTIVALARVGGLSSAGVLRYFKNKDEILRSLTDDVAESLGGIVEKARSRSESPLDTLKSLLREHLSLVEQGRGVSFVIIAEALRSDDPVLRRRMEGILTRYLEAVEDICADAARSGDVSQAIDLRTASVGFFGLLQGTVTLWRLTGGDFPLVERHEHLWRLFTEGIAQK